MNRGAYFLAVPVVLLAACTPKLSSSLSREEALHLYCGEISEARWIEQLDTISRNLPFNNLKSVQLADGFLFYESELRDGEMRVVNVFPPPDAPEELKAIAKSLQKNPPPAPKKLYVGDGILRLDGASVSIEDLQRIAGEIRDIPAWKRPLWQVDVNDKVLAAELAKVQKVFEENGLETKLSYVSESPNNGE